MKTRSASVQFLGIALVIAAASAAVAGDAVPQTTPPQDSSPTVSATAAKAPQKPIAPPPATANAKVQPPLTGWAAEILKLSRGSLDEDVILSYVDSAGTFNLTADQIVTFTEAGVSRNIISAMIQHDAEIVAGVREVLPGLPPSPGIETILRPAPPAKVVVAQAKAPVFPAPDDDDIVAAVTPPPPEWAALASQPAKRSCACKEKELSPVRKPYAVKLTDPILVWPAQARVPNVMTLESFP